MAQIKVELDASEAEEAWMVIDSKDLAFDENGKATLEVDSALTMHRYLIWVEGPPGSSASFKIKQQGDVLAEGKPTVPWGGMQVVQHHGFALKY